MKMNSKEESYLLEKILKMQETTNDLLTKLIKEIQEIKHLLSEMSLASSSEMTVVDLFDPQVLLKYNKRMQDVIKEVAKFFQKGNEKIIVEDLQELMNISYPQAAHYLNELEKEGLIASRRGNRKKGENPLKKYYFLPK